MNADKPRAIPMNRIYIANMGEANALWPRAQAHDC